MTARRRLPTWDASGYVEKAWKRINPPTQEELRRRLGLKAHTNLSKLNQGKMPMTYSYAQRIVVAVRQDDPTFTVADLGAPLSVANEEEPTLLVLLEQLEDHHEDLRQLVLRAFGALRTLVPPEIQPALEVPPSLAQPAWPARRGRPENA